MSQVTIQDVGPVKHITFEVPDGGGICILKGRNGKGKSQTLDAVDALVTGKGSLSVRDGALHGEVNGFGARITVGRSTRRSGELEVVSLDGRLDVSVLVDPLIKSPEAADARRIKALVQLAKILPAADLFYDLAGGQADFERVITPAALASDDLVAMAERIKRDFEAEARREESKAEHAEGHARGARESAAGVDANAECDSAKVQAELEDAIRHESDLTARRVAADKATRQAQAARDSLEDAEAAYKGKSVADCRTTEEAAGIKAEWAAAAVTAAQEALRKAQADQQAANTAYSHAIAELMQAEEHEKVVAQWREQLRASVPPKPSDEMLATAQQRVTVARQAVEQAGVVRRAKEQLEKADRHTKEAGEHRRQAAKLRNAAQGTDGVLSEVVARSGSPLRVSAGRLVLQTTRGETYFGDLSHGERWKIALDIAIEAIGERGVLTVPQECWEGLDIFARQAIAEHVAGRGVIVLTAEASADEEIVAEVFDAAQ